MEEESQDKIKERKEKIINWIKNPYNAMFIGILALGIIIRLYYFNLTKSQPVWFDESDYLAYATYLAGITPEWIITWGHNSLFPFLLAGLFKIGFSEAAAKFTLVLIPSILLILLTYLICNEIYKDKRIALISSFLMVSFWNILFNSFRFHVGVPALLFGFLAIYVFFKGYEKKEKIFGKINSKWAIPLTTFFVFLTYATRRGYFLFGIFFFVYILSTRKFKDLIKDKYNWIAVIIAGVMLFLIEKFIFVTPLTEVSEGYIHFNQAIAWIQLTIFDVYFTNAGLTSFNILYYLFCIGFFLLLFNLCLFLGHLKKTRKLNIKADLFFFLTIFITLSYFIFFQRDPTIGDPRWYFPLLLGSFICISKSTLFIADYAKRYNKYLAVILVIFLIGFGGYYQVKHADQIIKVKIPSFEGIKQASLFIGDIAMPEDITLLHQSVPQAIYYSKKNIVHIPDFVNWTGLYKDVPMNMTFKEISKNPNAKYFIVTFSEPGHPPWMQQTTQTSWRIPFMDTQINFQTGEQDIKQSKIYEEYDLEFKLLTIKQDAFVYEIIHLNQFKDISEELIS